MTYETPEPHEAPERGDTPPVPSQPTAGPDISEAYIEAGKPEDGDPDPIERIRLGAEDSVSAIGMHNPGDHVAIAGSKTGMSHFSIYGQPPGASGKSPQAAELIRGFMENKAAPVLTDASEQGEPAAEWDRDEVLGALSMTTLGSSGWGLLDREGESDSPAATQGPADEIKDEPEADGSEPEDEGTDIDVHRPGTQEPAESHRPVPVPVGKAHNSPGPASEPIQGDTRDVKPAKPARAADDEPRRPVEKKSQGDEPEEPVEKKPDDNERADADGQAGVDNNPSGAGHGDSGRNDPPKGPGEDPDGPGEDDEDDNQRDWREEPTPAMLARIHAALEEQPLQLPPHNQYPLTHDRAETMVGDMAVVDNDVRQQFGSAYTREQANSFHMTELWTEINFSSPNLASLVARLAQLSAALHEDRGVLVHESRDDTHRLLPPGVEYGVFGSHPPSAYMLPLEEWAMNYTSALPKYRAAAIAFSHVMSADEVDNYNDMARHLRELFPGPQQPYEPEPFQSDVEEILWTEDPVAMRLIDTLPDDALRRRATVTRYLVHVNERGPLANNPKISAYVEDELKAGIQPFTPAELVQLTDDQLATGIQLEY